MKTRILQSISEAANVLRAGGLCAFPTETVYGLGADATQSAAIERLFLAKGRPSDNPLIVHLGRVQEIHHAAAEVPDTALELLHAFSPGPITVVLPKNPAILDSVTAGLDTVGVRIPDNSIARELITKSGALIAAPSANRSGRPSCTTWQSVVEDLDGQIDAVLQGDDCSIGIESSVVDCTGETPVLLRPGGVPLEDLQAVIPCLRPLHEQPAAACSTARSRDMSHDQRTPNSPGLRHAHYQPRATVILLDTESATDRTEAVGRTLYVGVGDEALVRGSVPGQRADRVIAIQNVQDYAAGFYEILRQADRDGFSTIFLDPAPADGLGRSLLDRQRRAAAPRNS